MEIPRRPLPQMRDGLLGMTAAGRGAQAAAPEGYCHSESPLCGARNLAGGAAPPEHGDPSSSAWLRPPRDDSRRPRWVSRGPFSFAVWSALRRIWGPSAPYSRQDDQAREGIQRCTIAHYGGAAWGAVLPAVRRPVLARAILVPGACAPGYGYAVPTGLTFYSAEPLDRSDGLPWSPAKGGIGLAPGVSPGYRATDLQLQPAPCLRGGRHNVARGRARKWLPRHHLTAPGGAAWGGAARWRRRSAWR